ncbi:MAG: ABC transporter permease, partial [Eggerthellaceae bacterium]
MLIDQTGVGDRPVDLHARRRARALGQTGGILADLEESLSTVQTDVLSLGESGALAKAFGKDGLDAAKIADFMGSPTELVTEQLYELNAYGSAMAPLFMNLTFWIGAFMLLVIMKQEVDGEGMRNLTISQRYLGRFLLLAAMAVLQAVICCAGVLALGVHAANAPALFFAAVVASLSYLSIIYA